MNQQGWRDLYRLLGLAKGEWGWALAGVLLTAGVILANTALLGLSGWFIAAMALAGHGGPGLDFFAPAAAIRGLAILRATGRYTERLVTHNATFRLLTKLRVWFYERLEPLAPAVLERERGGDLLSRLRADIDRLETFYLRVAVPSAAALLAVPLLLALLAWLYPGAAWIEAAGLVVAGLVLPLCALTLGRAPGRVAAAKRGQYSADMTEILRGHAELLVAGALTRIEARAEATALALEDAQRHQGGASWVTGAVGQFTAQLCLWGTLIITVPRAASGLLSGPDVAALALLTLAGFEAVAGLPGAWQALGESLASARRVFELADATPALQEPARPAPSPTRFDLYAEELVMRYAPDLPPVLQGLRFDVPEGGCLGITGPSGAGKSSLLSLLPRFRDYQSGSLRLGGVEVRSLPGETLRGVCAMVTQQAHLFNTSIRENLLIAKPDADDTALRDALREAALLDEVLAMPAGLDTLVGEAGAALSGGQMRRLAIARAFLADARILLLDEPTEGLDAATEQRVLEALARLRQGRTTLLVSHRPQALRLADKIFTLS
jgi:ATP-binding cassette subfamily C protein CydC